MVTLPALCTLAMVAPQGEDLWAFYALTALWGLIFTTTWLVTSWLRDPAPEDGHRGL